MAPGRPSKHDPRRRRRHGRRAEARRLRLGGPGHGRTTYGAAVDQLFYYTGQERDAATGLQLHGHRWYDPAIGRWLSEDPSSLGSDPNLYRYVGNSYPNYTDSTGLTQAGNPLDTLFGGYSGNQVAAYVAPNPYAASLASSLSPIITQPRPTSSPSVGIGTLGSALGNASFNAGASYVSPGTKAAIGTLNVASSIALTGGFFGDTYDAITGYPRGIKDSIDRSFKSAYNGVAYALEHPSGALGSVASGVESALHTGLDYTIGWGLEYKRNQNLRSIENKYDALQHEFNRLKDASVYDQARATGDFVGTVGQMFLPAGNLVRGTRTASALRPLAIIEDVAPSTFVQRTNGAVNGRYCNSCRYLGNEEGSNRHGSAGWYRRARIRSNVFLTAIN